MRPRFLQGPAAKRRRASDPDLTARLNAARRTIWLTAVLAGLLTALVVLVDLPDWAILPAFAVGIVCGGNLAGRIVRVFLAAGAKHAAAQRTPAVSPAVREALRARAANRAASAAEVALAERQLRAERAEAGKPNPSPEATE